MGLNMYDMDMRQYDPAIGRWVVQDPVVHHDMSPYNAFDNNPVFWADPSGADSQTGQTDSNGSDRFDNLGMYIPPLERFVRPRPFDNADEDRDRRNVSDSDPPGKTRAEENLIGFGKGVINGIIDGTISSNPVYDAAEKIGKIFDEDFELIPRMPVSKKQETAALAGGVVLALVEPGPGGEGKIIKSLVKSDSKLFKLAKETFMGNKTLSKNVNSLLSQIAKGNMNPGSGTKNIGGNIFELREKVTGARVYFRTVGGEIQILGYSHKKNQQEVIDRVLNLYR